MAKEKDFGFDTALEFINKTKRNENESIKDGEEKQHIPSRFEVKLKENKTSVLFYAPMDFVKRYDKFIKKYNRNRSEMIVAMLDFAMKELEGRGE